MIKLFESSYDSAAAYMRALNGPVAVAKFETDFAALQRADAVALILAAGCDSHAELGFVVGRNRPAFVLLPDPPGEPELMYRLPNVVVTASIGELIGRLRQFPQVSRIYVASSWTRSLNHPAAVAALRAAGFTVFDYRNPEEN